MNPYEYTIVAAVTVIAAIGFGILAVTVHFHLKEMDAFHKKELERLEKRRVAIQERKNRIDEMQQQREAREQEDMRRSAIQFEPICPLY